MTWLFIVDVLIGVFFFFQLGINLNKLQRRKSQSRNCLSQDWPVGISMRHSLNWCRRAQHTVISSIPGKVSLDCVRKLAEPGSSISSLWFLIQFLTPGFLSWLPLIMLKHFSQKLNKNKKQTIETKQKFFPVQVTFFHSIRTKLQHKVIPKNGLLLWCDELGHVVFYALDPFEGGEWMLLKLRLSSHWVCLVEWLMKCSARVYKDVNGNKDNKGLGCETSGGSNDFIKVSFVLYLN